MKCSGVGPISFVDVFVDDDDECIGLGAVQNEANPDPCKVPTSTPFICITSPSTRFEMTVASSSTTSTSRNLAKATDALPSKKSPPKMLNLFPNAEGDEGAPRRNSDSSITSSCSNDATWIISEISARRFCVGSTTDVVEEEEAAPALACCCRCGFKSFKILLGLNGSSIPVRSTSPPAAADDCAGEMPFVAALISSTINGRMCLPSAWK